jgi:hypothetical protein
MYTQAFCGSHTLGCVCGDDGVLGTQMATKRKRIVNAGAVSQQTGTKRSLIWDYFNNDLDSHKWTHGSVPDEFVFF